MRSLSRRGVSLSEAIIACFILTFAMMITASLFHSALNHSVRIDRKQKAARVAEQQVELIRSWSRAHHGTNGDLSFVEGWSAYDGVVAESPDNPGYTVATTVEPYELFSPSKEFEKINFAAMEDENFPNDQIDPNDPSDKRKLADSAYLETVTVSWGTRTGERLTTRTLVTDPVRDHGWDANNASKAITLEYHTGGSWGNSAPGFLAKNASLKLRAFVEDRKGEAVDNAVVTWYVDPDCTGKGTIVSLPQNPERAVFTNMVKIDQDPDVTGEELTVHTGGRVRLVARVRLGGIEAVKKTPYIQLGE